MFLFYFWQPELASWKAAPMIAHEGIAYRRMEMP